MSAGQSVDPAHGTRGDSAARQQSSRSIQRIARIGGWKLDLQTNALAWSSAMFRLYGAARGAPGATPQDCLATVAPEDLSLTEQAYAQALREREPINFVHRVRRSDGAIRHIEIRGEVAYAGGGRPLRATGAAQDVTGTLQVQRALQASQARLESVFAAMSEGLVIHAADGAIVDANPAALEILGLTRVELIDLASIASRWHAVCPDGTELPGADHPAMVTLRTGAAIRGQIMGIDDPKRGLCWLSVNSNPVVAAGHSPPQAVVATFVDVTQSRLRDAEQAAAASALDDLYDNAPCGYHTLDANARIVSVNATELGWLGLTRDEVLGRPVADFMSPRSREEFADNFARFKREGRIDGVEYDYGPLDGPKRRVRVHASILFDQGARFLRSRSVLTEITDPHRVREQLRCQLNEQIAMIDNGLIGIVRVRDRRILWANHGVRLTFGHAPKEIEGASTRILYADEDTYRSVGEAMRQDRREGHASRMQVPMVRKNGEAIWIDLSTVLLSAASGESMGVLVDVTSIRQAQEGQLQIVELEAQNLQITEANRLKSAFLSNMSHELCTPLNAVLGLTTSCAPAWPSRIRLSFQPTSRGSKTAASTCCN